MTTSKRESDARRNIPYAPTVGQPMSTGTDAVESVFDKNNQLVGIQAPPFRGEDASPTFGGFHPNSQRRRRSTLAPR